MGNGQFRGGQPRACYGPRVSMGDRTTQGSSQPVHSKSKTSMMSSLERDQLGQRGIGDAPCAGLLRGLDHIRDPQLNKAQITRVV